MSPATVAKTISSSPIIGHMLIGGKLVDSAEGGWIDASTPPTRTTSEKCR
jgi:hypothetical protein